MGKNNPKLSLTLVVLLAAHLAVFIHCSRRLSSPEVRGELKELEYVIVVCSDAIEAAEKLIDDFEKSEAREQYAYLISKANDTIDEAQRKRTEARRQIVMVYARIYAPLIVLLVVSLAIPINRAKRTKAKLNVGDPSLMSHAPDIKSETSVLTWNCTCGEVNIRSALTCRKCGKAKRH